MNSFNCLNFSEDLSCEAEDLSLFNKSLISNESDDYETLEPCVLSDVFDNSVHDQPKEPLVETFENVSDINVKNRLTSHAQFWRDIGASPWVMRVIEQGYSLPFTVEPPPAFFTNNQSAFVSNEIQRLLETGCIREVERDEAHIVSPLCVAENSEKLRLILDLRYLNSFLSVPKFKYEDVRSIRDLFNKGDFFFKFDIKHGYHHVNIDKAYHKYLSFSWSENGITKYYVLTVLVFGLATAPFVFTKVVKILVGYWRGGGIGIFSFIDDFFGGASTYHQTAIIVKMDLELRGFVANVKKSQWHPSQEGMHLGFLVDLKNGIFTVPKSRVYKLKDLLRQLHGKARTTARCLARVVGSIISMGLGIGPVSRMWTRRLYANLNQASAWDRPLTLASDALKELEF